MSTASIFGLLGGLALFLYGMQMMSTGLEAAAGNKMRVRYLLDIKHIHTEKLGASVICVEGIKKELMRMMDMARRNVQEAFDAILVMEKRREKHSAVEQREEYVDFLNKEISIYITSAVSHEITSAGSQLFNSLFTITGNIERISDHAVNIAGYSNMISDKEIVFSEQAKEEVAENYIVADTCTIDYTFLWNSMV